MMPNIEDRESAVLLFNRFRDVIYDADFFNRANVKPKLTECQQTSAFRSAMCYRATQYYYKVLSAENITDGTKELFIDNIKQVYPNIIVW